MLDNIRLVNELAFHKIKQRYSEQLFGMSWAIINPLVYVFCFWFFNLFAGRGSGYVGDVPYILWLIPGVIVFRFLVSCLTMGSTVLTSNAMLIKGVKFNVKLIPIIEVIKEFYIHCIVILALGIIFIAMGYSVTGGMEYMPDIYYLNFLFYFPVLLVYCLSFVIPLSILGLLIRDTKFLISAISQPLFWLTPIGYTINADIYPRLAIFEKLFNPFCYFIDAYRDTMIFDVFFWEHTYYNLYIVIVIIFNFAIGAFMWKKVRPYMSDLL